MAKATANCICLECGSEFTKSKTCYNRTEANNWEKWAEENYTQCPKCWGKEKREKEQKQPLTLNISLNPFSDSRPIVLHFSGNTINNKDNIKSIGGYFWGQKAISGLLGIMENTIYCWNKTITVAEMDAEIKKAVSIGAKIQNNITEVDMLTFAKIQKEQEEKQEKIDAIPKPAAPEILKGVKWNQKIYGKKGSYSFYNDGKKITITDSQKEEIEQYLKKKEAYNKAIEEIK